MAWMDEVRARAQARIEQARRNTGVPPFPGDAVVEGATPVVMVDASPRDEDGLPRPVRVAGAWSWRLLLFLAVGWVLLRMIAHLDVVIIPVLVAVLLAAMFQPVAAWLRGRGLGRSLASALVLIVALVVVFGGLGLIINTFVSQIGTLSTQVGDGVREVQDWLARGPLHISQQQINDYIDQAQRSLTENRGALTSGAVTTATTVGEVGTGFFLTLFTLFFFLRDGDQIWRFLCRLLPSGARVPTARAGHYSWHTLVAYVHATVLVAFVDAIGIGIGLFALSVPLALPLAALVFLGGFVPVVGATVSGAVAVLVALVTVGPVKALILLGVVIAVQQLEGHVLQPLIMGRAVALHPLAVILAIASGVVLAGIVGGLIAVPLLAVLNTAVRYLVRHPGGEPTPDREPPGTEEPDGDSTPDEPAPGPDTPPPARTSLA
ncbi:AI-2E family transporter [Paractinoplanes brasiliensis]|uniref:Putative PurR-regulated permease PerM n=1 Tax=Paractinoplanes brasiliensis TaxID=52695 RepID=A0A4R6J8A5_9ACTN|nr:AI-2E family transporter [Actinoplanes brasiliensis]TDO31387.1 putative PurR-regulated permease PerM [Actinoplanes brasiliensis]GID33445.1 AI-2E family transporter [Actinoplanes brasiliensis]